MSTPTLIERARALLSLAPTTTQRPWSWWTSCSFRRLSSDVTRRDGDVLHGTIQRHDNHPDVACSEVDRAWIEGASNAGEPLAAFAVDFAKALPGLYREHGFYVEGGHDELGYREGWHFCKGAPCTCGVHEHNARLDALADKLGIPPSERRP